MPQCGTTITTSAPSRRARAMSRLAWASLSDAAPGRDAVASSAGSTSLYARKQMCCPTRSKQTGSRAALASRPAPTTFIPTLRTFAIDSTTPSDPASRMWLLASETMSMPARPSPTSSAGSNENRSPCGFQRKSSGAGPSWLTIARSALLNSRRTAPACPARRAVDLGPAELVAAAAGRDRPEAAVPREVGTLAEPHGLAVDVAVEVDVAGRRQRPDRGRVVLDDRARPVRLRWPGDHQRPRVEGPHVVDAEERLVPDTEGAHLGAHPCRRHDPEGASTLVHLAVDPGLAGGLRGRSGLHAEGRGHRVEVGLRHEHARESLRVALEGSSEARRARSIGLPTNTRRPARARRVTRPTTRPLEPELRR